MEYEDIKKAGKFVIMILPLIVWLFLLLTVSMVMDVDASMSFEYNVMNVLLGYGLMIVGTVSLIFFVVWSKSFDDWYDKNFKK